MHDWGKVRSSPEQDQPQLQSQLPDTQCARRLIADDTVQPASDLKFADYKPGTAFFFPGQGAQSVGMAKVRLPACVPAVHVAQQAAGAPQSMPAMV